MSELLPQPGNERGDHLVAPVPSVTENLAIMLHLCDEVVGLPTDYPLPGISLEDALEEHATHYKISMELAREDYERSKSKFIEEVAEEIRRGSL